MQEAKLSCKETSDISLASRVLCRQLAQSRDRGWSVAAQRLIQMGLSFLEKAPVYATQSAGTAEPQHTRAAAPIDLRGPISAY